MLGTILMVFALVLLILAALNVPSSPRINLGWAGLACYVAAVLLGNLHIG
jgi:hypothetical protein